MSPLDAFELYFEDVKNKRHRTSRLSSLDGFVDRLGGFAHSAASTARIIYREIIGGK